MAPDSPHLGQAKVSDRPLGSHATVPNYPAAILLDPKATFAPVPKPRAKSMTPYSSSPNPIPLVDSGLPAQLAVQFSTPIDEATPDLSRFPRDVCRRREHSLPVTPIFQNAFSCQIERANNVQERSDVPQPKRRKTEQVEDPSNAAKVPFLNGGGGMLSDYVKQERGKTTMAAIQASACKAGVKPPAAIDLTGGREVISIDKSAQEIANEEVCYGMVEGATINCHKVPAPKPGMTAFGGPMWWPQVKVVLRRKVNDSQKMIHVYDHTRTVFGMVDAKIANPLAPLIESNLSVRTDCRISSRKKLPGEDIIGQVCSRSIKFELMLYGPRKYGKRIGEYLDKFSVRLLSPTRVEPGLQVVNPQVREARARSVPSRNGSSDSLHAMVPVPRTVEEVRSEVMSVFDSLPTSESLPEITPDSYMVSTPLLRHQRQALYFMTDREENHALLLPGDGTHSIWSLQREAGRTIYHNVITGLRQSEAPKPVKGGILADMMGLGKTLSILSLVTKTKAEAASWHSVERLQSAGVDAPHKKPLSYDVPKSEPLAMSKVKRHARATLLVCPLSTITNWEEQIKQHICGPFSYYVYHGPNRNKDVQELSKYDLVLTTYGSVSSELSARLKRKGNSLPLEEIAWFRIVLDEAHMIREQNTLAFKSIVRLPADRRWAVTGTPIQNKLDDFAALLAFLRVSPFESKGRFIQHIVQPFKAADADIIPKLRVLIDTITIRRLKDKIDLPPRTDEIVKLDFSPEERKIYDACKGNAEDRIKALTNLGLGQGRIVGGKTYIHILRAILRLRLICAHGKDLLNDEDLEFLQGATAATAIDLDSDADHDAALREKNVYDTFYYMQETNQDKCFQCNCKLDSEAGDGTDEDVLGYMGSCFHVFCPCCVKKPAPTECDICNGVEKKKCFELHRSRANMEHETHTHAKAKGHSGKTIKVAADGKELYPDYTPRTKTIRLVEELLATKQQSINNLNPNEPPYKSVVFSGWTSHLDLIGMALSNAGITYTRLDGKMTRTARTAAMDAFREDAKVEVILVSIMAGGLGLNLTSGNNVYVMEPQFNPAAEAQAVDRVHRLGQTRPVRIVRFIMVNSFEEKMLELQEKKKKLASLSMDSNGKAIDRGEAARERLKDLRTLFR